MKKYLTVDAKFKCNASPKVNFTCLESVNKKVKYNGKNVLTDSVKLIGSGQCKPLTLEAQGTPIPCCCSLQGWISTDNVAKICGKVLLVESSRNFCAAAPVPVPITVKQSGTDGKFFHGD